jgi:hypothetical protein
VLPKTWLYSLLVIFPSKFLWHCIYKFLIYNISDQFMLSCSCSQVLTTVSSRKEQHVLIFQSIHSWSLVFSVEFRYATGICIPLLLISVYYMFSVHCYIGSRNYVPWLENQLKSVKLSSCGTFTFFACPWRLISCRKCN